MDDTVVIEIRGLRVYANHGVMPQERKVGNIFIVDVRAEYPAAEAVEHDALSGTMNYAETIALIKDIMATPSALIEHVAGRIRAALLERWPLIRGGIVRVSKPEPPVECEIGSVSVSVKLR